MGPKTMRALALVSIAHPDFRGELLAAAKERRLVFLDQVPPRATYPRRLERELELVPEKGELYPGVREALDELRVRYLGKSGQLTEQLKKLGASCDWKRTKFTMDEPMSASVIKVFVDLYRKGAIYRGYLMFNCDPQAKTTLSDK